MPNTGDTAIVCEQAGRTLMVNLSVQTTPNPNFRRVDAQVSEADVKVLTLSTVMGRN
jgi:general secretion pathway protein I